MDASAGTTGTALTTVPALTAAERRTLEKEAARIERSLAKLDEQEAALHGQMAECATDHARLGELGVELRQLQERRDSLEAEWMAVAERLG